MIKNYLFFDHASTTKCCPEAAELVHRFGVEDFGNPSSAHAFGTTASRAIKEARAFFAAEFGTEEGQVIFTGSGSESDNLAIYGVAMNELARRTTSQTLRATKPPRILFSAIEHAAVKRTAISLAELGFEALPIPVSSDGIVLTEKLQELLTPETLLVSVMHVNNIVGSIQPIEELAKLTHQLVPNAVFHCDAVQSFGKMPTLRNDTEIDLVSISAHKIEGPKGIGALIALKKNLIKAGLRPLIWGGDQEGGLRSGTPNAGLIAGFHAAAKKVLTERPARMQHIAQLNRELHDGLKKEGILSEQGLIWNSPIQRAAPHIISMSFPGYPAQLLASLLEQRGCLVSMGSACSTGKPDPDPVLTAMGMDPQRVLGAIRVSLSAEFNSEDILTLVSALKESTETLRTLLGPPRTATLT